MKQKIVSVLFASTLILGACGEEAAKPENDSEMNVNQTEVAEDTENDGDVDETVEVDKKLINVEITLPASFLELEDGEEVDIDEIKKEAKENGIKDVEVNNDGSITYTMSKSKHRELLDEMQEGIEENIDEVVNSEDFPSIKDIKANNAYDEYEVIVDREGYENSFDGFGVFGVAFSSMYYQLFEGVNPDDYEVIVNLKDEETGEVFNTITYPDALDEE